MASAADYTNPVPLGEAGTGAAYILPQSTALAGFNDYLDNQGVDRQKAAVAKAKQASDIAKNWKEAQLNIKGGTIFQPEINQRANHVMQMGMDLQKLGVDPQGYSNNPQTQALLSHYQQERAALLSDSELRDKISTEVGKAHEAYAKEAPGYYDPASMDDINNYVSGKGKYGSLSDISANGYQVPTLQRTYDMQGAVDKLPTSPIKTVSTDPKTGVKTDLVLPDEDAHTQTAHSFIQNTPEAKANVEKQIGMPIANLPATSDVGTIKSELDDHYKSMPSIPGLAAQGFKTFGAFGQNNSNGVPDVNSSDGAAAPNASSPNYDQFITKQATQLAQAKNKYDAIVDNVKQTLDNKVHKENDSSYDFAYQREMRERAKFGQENIKFGQWMKDQQGAPGEFSVGNANSTVPVPTATLDSNGKPIPGKGGVRNEKGASLFGVNLPEVKQVVTPSTITDLKTGQTRKNAAPVEMTVSRIQMVPTFKGTGGNADGNELSYRQLQQLVTGTGDYKDSKLNLGNITFKPYVYGLQTVKDKFGHSVYTPVKVPYDAMQGVNNKKIITNQFDTALQGLQQLQQNPKFIALPPDQKLEFLKQHYNISDQ